jgi:hypothetical protein
MGTLFRPFKCPYKSYTSFFIFQWRYFFCHFNEVARGKPTIVGLRVMNMQVCWLKNDLVTHMLALNQYFQFYLVMSGSELRNGQMGSTEKIRPHTGYKTAKLSTGYLIQYWIGMSSVVSCPSAREIPAWVSPEKASYITRNLQFILVI